MNRDEIEPEIDWSAIFAMDEFADDVDAKEPEVLAPEAGAVVAKEPDVLAPEAGAVVAKESEVDDGGLPAFGSGSGALLSCSLKRQKTLKEDPHLFDHVDCPFDPTTHLCTCNKLAYTCDLCHHDRRMAHIAHLESKVRAQTELVDRDADAISAEGRRVRISRLSKSMEALAKARSHQDDCWRRVRDSKERPDAPPVVNTPPSYPSQLRLVTKESLVQQVKEQEKRINELLTTPSETIEEKGMRKVQLHMARRQLERLRKELSNRHEGGGAKTGPVLSVDELQRRRDNYQAQLDLAKKKVVPATEAASGQMFHTRRINYLLNSIRDLEDQMRAAQAP